MRFCPRGLFLSFSTQQSLLYLSFVLPRILGLKCAVCRKVSYKGVGPQQSEMVNLRISYNLPRPYCRYLEEIICDRDQDVCVTVITNMKQNGYWVTMGCSRRDLYPPNQKGCDRLKSDSRTVTYDKEASGRRRINEDRVVSEVCVCNTHHCNTAVPAVGRRQIKSVISCLILNFLLIWYFHARIRH